MSCPALMLGGKVTLEVATIDRAVGFYTAVLGFRLRLRVGDDWAEVVASGLVIALHRRIPAVAVPRRRASDGPVLSLEVEDLAAAVASWRARGVEIRPWLLRDKLSRGVVVVDPDGNPLHLREAVYAV